MWDMWESEGSECDECGGIGPPPKFTIPPPPRPPFLHELSNDCSEDPLPEIEMCDAISILDINYHTELSFQASAVIVLFSLILVLVIIISTIFVWKHKRKVQNFLPCKTPTRGGHLNATGASGHSVTYEDPDAHIGHRPLVMRHHHHNMEMLHPKTIHYPSGYPMPRSPPLFICSSPGPDPYRSHDNVYEELEHHRETDSELPMQSDDEFAEDELSLPGDRSLHKSSPDTTTVATIYHERSGSSANGNDTSSTYLERNRMERNSLLSSSSSGNDNGRQFSSSTASTANRNSNSSTDGGVSLFRTRKQNGTVGRTNNNKPLNYGRDDISNTTDLLPPTTVYDDRSLIPPPSYNSVTSVHSNTNNNNNHHHLQQPASVISSSNHNHNHSNSNNNNVNNNNSLRSNYYSSIDAVDPEVERRNRINSQLSSNAVATIYRDRNNGRYPHFHPPHMPGNGSSRSRTQPRPSDRRRCGDISVQEPAYMYQEPVCLSQHHTFNQRAPSSAYPYIMSDFSSFRNPPPPQQQFQSPYSIAPASMTAISAHNVTSGIYAPRNPSNFGSDSGYHTANHQRPHPHHKSGTAINNNNNTGGTSANRSFWSRKKKDKANVVVGGSTPNSSGAYDGS